MLDGTENPFPGAQTCDCRSGSSRNDRILCRAAPAGQKPHRLLSGIQPLLSAVAFVSLDHSHSLLCFALPRMESGGGSGPGQFLFHEKCPLSACHRLSGRSGRRVFLCWKYRLFAVGSKPPKYLPVLLLLFPVSPVSVGSHLHII